MRSSPLAGSGIVVSATHINCEQILLHFGCSFNFGYVTSTSAESVITKQPKGRTMSIQQFKQDAEACKSFADKGREHITRIHDYITQVFPGIFNSYPISPCQYHMDYHGYILKIRVELNSRPDDIEGFVVVYEITNDIQKPEKEVTRYWFDTLGNIRIKDAKGKPMMRIEDFPYQIIDDVLNQRSIVLRPN